MIHRVVPIGTFAALVLEQIRTTGAFKRSVTTDFRGEVAFVGGCAVHAVGTLVDVVPTEDGLAYEWQFTSLQRVEDIIAPHYGRSAMFENRGQSEPMFLAATAQKLLSEYLESLTWPNGKRPEVATMPLDGQGTLF